MQCYITQNVKLTKSILNGIRIQFQYKFAYKSKISAIHCVNSVNETVNYYINISGKVYACTLDVSKAFDRVNLLTLFKNLFKRNMCPLFLRFLIHSYCNQKSY